MRVFLTGATGFIGGHILRALVNRGHAVTCLARGSAAAAINAMALPGVIVVSGEFTAPASYLHHVAGHDVVINAVGIIRETPHASFDAVHNQATCALFDAAAQAGVRKIVQISAIGADEGAQSRYHLSKRAADRHLAGFGVPCIVLRPSLVYGPQDHSMTFFFSLAALPVTPVPGDGRYLLQPVHVDDLVRAVVQSIERDDLCDGTLDIGGSRQVSFNELLDVLARRLGKAHTWKVHVPWAAMNAVAAVTDALGGHGPISGEELAMLRRNLRTSTRSSRRSASRRSL